MSYREICSCVNCEAIFVCNPEHKTRLCAICDTPENRKLKWEGKLEMPPCQIQKETVLVISEGVQVKPRSA